jgi:hypothetical protein
MFPQDYSASESDLALLEQAALGTQGIGCGYLVEIAFGQEIRLFLVYSDGCWTDLLIVANHDALFANVEEQQGLRAALAGLVDDDYVE